MWTILIHLRLHWRIVLNTCAGNFQSYSSYYDERDCGCILFARDTLTYFVGSYIGYCYWATFGLVFSLLFCFIFGCFHVYRVCCKTPKPRSGKMEIRQRSTEVMQLTVEQEIQEVDGISPYFWTPASIIALIMVIYGFVHAIMLTDGFLTTCKQYRNRVIKHTLAKGEMVSCSEFRFWMDKINYLISGWRHTIAIVLWSCFRLHGLLTGGSVIWTTWASNIFGE